ncbi:MAG: hypothetical protein IPO67_27245 [Deltaproteobacteria bacterium]|nr:hypothetical protein [Deltaproteobacteria bacterium]
MDLKPIERFLVSALTEDELRRLCTHLPGGAALALALPGHGVAFAELAHQAVGMLHRQRRLDAAFFEGLRELVPNRAPEIQALAEGAPSVVVGLVSFALNIAAVRDGLCRAPGLRGACVALDLGHLPSPGEEASWAAVQRGGDCVALREHLNRWPTVAFPAEAQARLDGRSVTTDTRWALQETRLPMTVWGEALFDDEQAAREDALRRAAALADETCAPPAVEPHAPPLGRHLRRHRLDVRADWAPMAVWAGWRGGVWHIGRSMFDGEAP